MEREFVARELFDIKKGKRLTKAEMKPGRIAFIGSSADNNGVTARIGNTEHLHPANTFTASYNGSVGEVFLQEEPFWASDDVNVWYPRFDYSRECIHYVMALVRKLATRYSYTAKWTIDKMRDEIISLPVIPSSDPSHVYTPDDIDWGYMERYIAELEAERIAELEAYLTATGLDDCDLTCEDEATLAAEPVTEREFLLKDVAELEYGNKFDKNKMTHNDPCYNFIGRTEKNNGITDFVDDNGTEPFAAGTITLAFGGSIGSTFIQPLPYYTSQNVGVITLPDCVSENAKMYFVKTLEKVCKNRYVAFADEINKHFKTDLSISLPVIESTDPSHVYTPDDIDWGYMERYIRAVEKLVMADVVVYKDRVIETTRRIVSAKA